MNKKFKLYDSVVGGVESSNVSSRKVGSSYVAEVTTCIKEV